MIKVSVIIPVYNGEKFINKTLNSVLKQDLKWFEIIVIDDGSMDSTAKKVKEIFANNTRSDVYKHYYYQSNSGVSVARNNGLEKARGKYVFFLDSDDLVDTECLMNLYNKAEKTKSDVTICGYDKVDDNGKIIRKYEQHFGYFKGVLDGQDALIEMLRREISVWTCSQLFRKIFLRKSDLKYQPGALYGEDQEFTMKALFLASRVSCVKRSLVKYVQRKTSVSHIRSLKRFHSVGSARRLKKFFERNCKNPEIIKLFNHHKSEICVNTINTIILGGFSFKFILM